MIRVELINPSGATADTIFQSHEFEKALKMVVRNWELNKKINVSIGGCNICYSPSRSQEGVKHYSPRGLGTSIGICKFHHMFMALHYMHHMMANGHFSSACDEFKDQGFTNEEISTLKRLADEIGA